MIQIASLCNLHVTQVLYCIKVCIAYSFHSVRIA